MKSVEQRLAEMGIVLSDPPTPVGSYKPAVVSGRHVFVSGQLPLKGGKLAFSGKLGDELTVEQGAEAARIAAVNTISALKSALGDLGRVRRIVKVTGYVASAESFHRQAQVLNGASDLYLEAFGEIGRHARAVVGVFELPLGAPVEIDLIAEIAL